jgi:hypothetical protein
MPSFIPWSAVTLLVITSLGLLVSREWRWSLALLAGQYFAAFWLTYTRWPLTMAATQLVTGWMAAAMLGMSLIHTSAGSAEESSWPQGSGFRLFAAGLVLIAVFASAPNIAAWQPGIGLPLVTGAFILIALGLLHLGMTAHPLQIILGLLTLLLGFVTIFSAIENSILIAGLLSTVNLSLALTGCYLLALKTQETQA